MKKNILQTEESICFVKEVFETEMKKAMNLVRVSSPIAVLDGTGINDDLNGTERSVKFPIKALGDTPAVVVNSLAKWKRVRLKELEVETGQGIITDMRAIRPDEDFSEIHSIYVDQWDWEKRMDTSERTLDFLKKEVRKIYQAIQTTEIRLSEKYNFIESKLPEEITFIQAEELLLKYPNKSPKEREHAAAKDFGAVFIMGIGGALSSGEPHDGRAPDYDDWSTKSIGEFQGLNGDILVWNPVTQKSLELSSMGIRVDKKALLNQLEISNQSERKQLKFHQMLLNEQLPQSIGGGIGQSRICMFLLGKSHIGEVQVGIWSEKIKSEYQKNGINLL